MLIASARRHSMGLEYKYEKDKTLLIGLEPILISIFFSGVLPIFKRELPEYDVTITRTISERIPGRSVSDSHLEGRAIDVRANDMSRESAKLIEFELNFVFADHFGAISLSDGKPRFCVLEDIDNANRHFHLQIRPGLPKDTLLSLITRGLTYTLMNKNAFNY